MDYEDFIELLRGKISESLRISGITGSSVKLYRNGYKPDDEAERLMVRGANERYHSVESDILIGDYLVAGSGRGICRFELASLYSTYRYDGWEAVSDIIEENIGLIADIRKQSALDRLPEYEFMKERLLVRIISPDEGLSIRNKGIVRRLGDIYQVIYAVIYEEEEDRERRVGLAVIPRKLIDVWGKSEELIWEQAYENTRKRFPPVLFPGSLNRVSKTMLIDSDFMRKEDNPLRLENYDVPTMTTGAYSDGAVAIFYPGVGERMAELFGGNYYLVFLSENEVRLHAKGSISVEAIRKCLSGIRDVLSERIYMYNAENKAFSVVG